MRSSQIRLLCCQLAVVFVPLVFNPYAVIAFGPAKAITWATLVIITIVLTGVLSLSAEKRTAWRPITHNAPIALYFAVYTLATINSIDVQTSIWGIGDAQGWATILIALLFFTVVSRLNSAESLQKLRTAAVFTAFVVAFYGAIQAIGLDPIAWQDDGTPSLVQSTLGRSTHLGAYLAIMLPLTLAAALDQPPPTRWRLGVIALLQTLVLLLTLSRAALIAGVVAIAVFSLLHQSTVQRSRLVLLAAAALFMIGGAYTLISRQVNQSTLRAGEYTLDEERARTVGFRLESWRSLPPLLADYWLLGHGPETFEQAHTAYYPREAWAKGNWLTDPHNVLLYHLTANGVLGLLTFLWIVATFYRQLWPLAQPHQATGRTMAIGLLASMSAYLAYAQFSPNSVTLLLLFWLLLGMGSTLHQLKTSGI